MTAEKLVLKEKIKLLVELQEKDSVLDRLRLKAGAVPVEIENQKSVIAQLRSEMDGKKGALTQLQMKRKEKEIELETEEGKIRKHNMELNAVKSNDAYRALLNEIENSKKAKSLLENDILELMDQVDKTSAELKAAEKEIKQKETGSQAVIASLENELRQLQEEIAAREQERNAFAAAVPDDILARYEYIRASRDGVAIAHIEGENCSGCHMALRPQNINEVFKGQDVIVCDSCQRILYRK